MDRNLVGYCSQGPWGHKESYTTKQQHTHATLGFHSFGKKREKNASKRTREKSDFRSHIYNTHTPQKPITVYNEDEEESYIPILTSWSSWVPRNSSGNRILQIWLLTLWCPGLIWSSHYDNSPLDLSNLESWTLLFSSLVCEFLDSFNIFYLNYSLLATTLWNRYISHIYSWSQLVSYTWGKNNLKFE